MLSNLIMGTLAHKLKDNYSNLSLAESKYHVSGHAFK